MVASDVCRDTICSSSLPPKCVQRFSGAIHIGNLKRRRPVHQFYPWMPTVLSQRPCGIANNSTIFSKFQKSSRENTQGVEIFLTEPLFTALLKNPLAGRRGAHQLPQPTFATPTRSGIANIPLCTGRKTRFFVFQRFSSSISGKM